MNQPGLFMADVEKRNILDQRMDMRTRNCALGQGQVVVAKIQHRKEAGAIKRKDIGQMEDIRLNCCAHGGQVVAPPL